MKGRRINWDIFSRNIIILFLTIILIFYISFYFKLTFQIENLNNEIETLKTENSTLQKKLLEKEQIQEQGKGGEKEEKHIIYKDCSIENKNTGLFRITAYCACEKCCGKWAVINGGGYTASGTKVEEGRTIAVYKNQIPFGTEVHIEGMGTYIAEDTGSAIKENCIDIYFDSHEEAKQFGVKYLNVVW